jgi:hypothetical protein
VSKRNPKDDPGTDLQRPYVLTRQTQARILRSLIRGNYITTAIKASGISIEGYYHWYRRWRDGDPGAQKFNDFFETIKRASAHGEQVALRNIQDDPANWQRWAWFLERRHHQNWGKKETVVVKGAKRDLSNLSDDELDDIIKRARRSR